MSLSTGATINKKTRPEFVEIKCSGFTLKPVEIGWHKCPYIKIQATTPNGKVVGSGYLMPFRGYSFQVCGNKDGEWDKGSTPVFGLDTFNHIQQSGMANLGQESTVKYFLSCIMRDAVEGYANTLWDHAEEDENGHHPTYHRFKAMDYGRTYKKTLWDKFVDCCYKFIQNGCDYTLGDEIPMWFADEYLSEEE